MVAAGRKGDHFLFIFSTEHVLILGALLPFHCEHHTWKDKYMLCLPWTLHRSRMVTEINERRSCIAFLYPFLFNLTVDVGVRLSFLLK